MITYCGFTKRYGSRTVVDALTLHVPPGKVVALLGPNGSGKTTSIKAAAGLVRPTAGRVVLGDEGLDASEPMARRVCAYLPQRVAFPEALTGREVVEFYRRLRGSPPEATGRVLAFASLNGASARPVGTYSGGMVQRLGLAVTMAAETPLLLLDEPTAALDPEGLAAFYALVDTRRNSGGSVFFSSHQLGDVERLADDVCILVGGRLAATFTASELAERLADRGVMRVRLAMVAPALLERVCREAPGTRWSGTELVVPGPASDRPRLLAVIHGAGGTVVGLTTEEGRLDELYRELIGSGS
jgi:Cu-processing system ATP-binding protein